jgi:hypothetical protein
MQKQTSLFLYFHVLHQFNIRLFHSYDEGIEGLRGVLNLGLSPTAIYFEESKELYGVDDLINRPSGSVTNTLCGIGTTTAGLTGTTGTTGGSGTVIPLRSSVTSLLGAAREQGVENALLEMCRHLEAENSRLEATLKELRKDVDDYAKEADVGKLIPHYRLAIVRCGCKAEYDND